MRALYFAVSLAAAIIFGAPAQAEQSYELDGSSLRSVQSTQGVDCSNWAIWYFKLGASQTPGNQWGADVGRSAEDVLSQQREHQQTEENSNAVNVKYHLKAPGQHLYQNSLGPICVTSTAFDAKPGAAQAIEEAGELSGRISNLIGQLRTILNGARTAIKTGYQGYYLQEGEKNELEEYLNKVEEIAENVRKVQNTLMQRLGPTMMQINGNLNTISNQLGAAEAGLPAISKLVSSPSVPTVSKAWMSKTQDATNYSETRIQTSFQEVPGGILVKTVKYNQTFQANVQFSNIVDVSSTGQEIYVRLKAPIANNNYTESLLFDNDQDARDAYDYLKAQRQCARTERVSKRRK
jgi:hypothetical protein